MPSKIDTGTAAADCDGTCQGCRNDDGCYADPGDVVRDGKIVRSARAEYVAGLRALADLLEGTPDLPDPMLDVPIQWNCTREEIAAFAKHMPGRLDKEASEHGLFYLRGRVVGLDVEAYTSRGEVCERVVIGTKTITETVLVGEDTRPVETVTREQDVVEWRCMPLLAEAAS